MDLNLDYGFKMNGFGLGLGFTFFNLFGLGFWI